MPATNYYRIYEGKDIGQIGIILKSKGSKLEDLMESLEIEEFERTSVGTFYEIRSETRYGSRGSIIGNLGLLLLQDSLEVCKNPENQKFFVNKLSETEAHRAIGNLNYVRSLLDYTSAV